MKPGQFVWIRLEPETPCDQGVFRIMIIGRIDAIQGGCFWVTTAKGIRVRTDRYGHVTRTNNDGFTNATISPALEPGINLKTPDVWLNIDLDEITPDDRV